MPNQSAPKSTAKRKMSAAERIVRKKLNSFYQKGRRRFEKAYKDKVFWKKIKKYFRKLGRGVVEEILTLYYCLSDSDTPKEVKIIIVCALGYLIVPLDLIPDLLLPIGFIDDAAAIALVIKTTRENITASHKKSARKKCKEIFEKT